MSDPAIVVIAPDDPAIVVTAPDEPDVTVTLEGLPGPKGDPGDVLADIGPDETLLVADSGEVTGVRWSQVADANVAADADIDPDKIAGTALTLAGGTVTGDLTVTGAVNLGATPTLGVPSVTIGGQEVNASGIDAVAFGNGAQQNASGQFSSAFGNGAQQYASGNNALAFGTFAQQYESGDYSSAFGTYAQNRASGFGATAFGTFAQQNSSGDTSCAFGLGAQGKRFGNIATSPTEHTDLPLEAGRNYRLTGVGILIDGVEVANNTVYKGTGTEASITAASGLFILPFLPFLQNTTVFGAYAYTDQAGGIAIGYDAVADTHNEVQIGTRNNANGEVPTSLRVGDHKYLSVAALKAVAADSADFEAFKSALAALDE